MEKEEKELENLNLKFKKKKKNVKKGNLWEMKKTSKMRKEN